MNILNNSYKLKLNDDSIVNIKFNMLIYSILENEFDINQIIKDLQDKIYISICKIVYANLKANDPVEYKEIIEKIHYDTNDFINIIKLVSDFFPTIKKESKTIENKNTDNEEPVENIDIDWLYFVCKTLFHMSDIEFLESSLRKISSLVENYAKFNGIKKDETEKIYDVDDIL